MSARPRVCKILELTMSRMHISTHPEFQDITRRAPQHFMQLPSTARRSVGRAKRLLVCSGNTGDRFKVFFCNLDNVIHHLLSLSGIYRRVEGYPWNRGLKTRAERRYKTGRFSDCVAFPFFATTRLAYLEEFRIVYGSRSAFGVASPGLI